MANLLILALAVVLFVVAVLSFVSYVKERKSLKIPLSGGIDHALIFIFKRLKLSASFCSY